MNQKTKPLISVCIPCYNSADFIGEAIESVIGQSFSDWELIVTDDASTDHSVEVIQQYKDRLGDRMIFKVAERNLGPSGNFNLMMSFASGDYIALLASDDRMVSERLETQVAYLGKNQEVGAVFSAVNIIDMYGNYLDQESVFSTPIYDIRKQLLNGNFINAPSGMLRTAVVESIGGFNPELLILQDYEYWLRILDNHEIVRLEEKLTDYRVHGDNLSIKPAGELASAAYYENVIVCVDTVTRWAELHQFEETRLEHYLFLARHAKRAEQQYLGSFKLAVPACI